MEPWATHVAADTSGFILFSSPVLAQVRSGEEAWARLLQGWRQGRNSLCLPAIPSKAGPFIIRAKMPSSYTIPPHSHPTTENVTLLSGDLTIGMGDKLAPETGIKLRPGDFISLEPQMNHFATTTNGVVIQISAQGFFEIIYVNPADDPRRKR